MKEKNRQRIGKVLLAVVVLLIVVIFSIWYIAGLLKEQEESSIVEPPKQEVPEQQVVQETPKPSIQKLSTEELEKISDRLNTAKDNPFVAILYQNPKEIKIEEVPYNGAVGTTTINNNEKMQVTEKIRKKQLDNKNPFSGQEQTYLQNSILKLKRTDLEAYFKQKTGVEIRIPKEVDELGIYLEETDSYYQARTSTNFVPIFCDNGTFNSATGIYTVEYHHLVAETEAEKYVVQMRMQDGEFVFVSNQEKK